MIVGDNYLYKNGKIPFLNNKDKFDSSETRGHALIWLLKTITASYYVAYKCRDRGTYLIGYYFATSEYFISMDRAKLNYKW